MVSPYFVIVGEGDVCLFEFTKADDNPDELLNQQMIAYSALDTVEDVIWTRSEYYFARVARAYGETSIVSAFIGITPVKLLLIEETEPKESRRAFFAEIYKICVEYLVSPFSRTTRLIQSRSTQDALNRLCTQHL